ncbi:MAG: hypothetical protein ACRCUI_08880, partial [Polymorphobacter sp.]
AADQLDVCAALIDDVVRLSGGSAYHAQLIGQKLVARARRSGSDMVDHAGLAVVVGEIVGEAALVDNSFDRLAALMRDNAALRGLLVQLANRALDDEADQVRMIAPASHGDAAIAGFDDRGEIYRSLIDANVLRRTEHAAVLRFANAFSPQLILMSTYLLGAKAAALQSGV